ncbi:MAG: T9SS type A sorting domain-containing protein [Fimbriimonadaceae bacterium]|nr:T9SS type A sorting domain-containing protein [Chitinophagales bacterium]
MKIKFYTRSLLIMIILANGAIAFAQLDPPCEIAGATLCDNFDAYTVGDDLGPGASWWTTWSGTEGGAEDGLITDEQAYSGTNSMLVEEGASNDILLLLGDQETGKWLLEWQVYIPDGKTGYYNIQNSEITGVYNLDVYYGYSAAGVPSFSGEAVIIPPFPEDPVNFTYPVGEWFKVKHIIDLDADLFDVYFDGMLVYSGPYTGNIGAIDFYSIDADNRYYIDDVLFMEVIASECVLGSAILCDNIDTYTSGETIGSFADWWTTWSGTEGGAEDGLVSSEQAHSGINSMLVPEGGSNDVILKLGDLTTGMYNLEWYAYVPDGKTGYYNIQKTESPGVEWELDAYFGYTAVGSPGESGEGVLLVDAIEVASFTYPVDAWFQVKHVIDLDANTIKYSIDSTLVYEGDYTGDIGGIDFYSIDANNRMYIDDVLLNDATLVTTTYYEDSDEDTYGNALSSITVVGDPPTGYVIDATDCDDANAAVHPGATEVCNGIDDDCDESIDEGLLITFYADADEDTYGDDGTTQSACTEPAGYVTNNTDCDDSNAAINPGATEVTNSVDDDCDELIDENVAIQNVNGTSVSMDVYPVPSNGNFTIEVTNTSSMGENMLLEIYNSSGQLIYNDNIITAAPIVTHKVNIENYAAGVYLLKLASGNSILVKQLMIE